MINERDQLNRLLDQYEDIAVEVIDDEDSNESRGLPYTNAQMSNVILEEMGWESFDLFQDMDFAEVYASDDAGKIRAYCFLAYLRLDMFNIANHAGVGDADFNSVCAVASEYWFRRLLDRCTSLTTNSKQPTKHIWLN